MPSPNRLSIVESIVHQDSAGPPLICEHRQTKILTQTAQPWVRRQEVSEIWTKLSYGWLDKENVPISLIHMKNLLAQPDRLPTPAEQEAENRRIILWGVMADSVVRHVGSILPGDTTVLYPVAYIWVRCMAGVANLLLHVYPA